MAMKPGPGIPARERRSQWVAVVVGFLLVPMVAIFDYLGGPEFGFSLFYLIPIAAVTLLGSWTSALLIAALAATAWLYVDVLERPDYTSILAPLWNSLTRFAFYALALVAIRSYREKLETAELKALSDPLTGLPNRQYLLIMLEAARARLERYGSPLTLAYLDIDDFKRVNDVHGHMAGDELLREVAIVLADCTRDTDTVARVGGDEFLILLPDSDGPISRSVLERVRHSLGGVKNYAGTDVSFSIGACTFHRSLESAEEMVRRADELMYRVKRTGKNALNLTDIA